MANVEPQIYLGWFSFLAATTPAPSQGIFIPLGSLPGLTAAEADPYTGDVRKIMYELNRIVFARFTALDPEGRPTKFTITRATPSGVNATTIRQSYITSFDLAIDNVDVAPEIN